MAVDIRNVTKKREQRYSYGLTLLRDCIEKDRVLPRDEDIFKKTILKVEDITINFGGLNALTDVNLELRDGELLAI
ncbi:MAG: hypothetical protein DRG35_04760, partial [Deltaproteobacteria bacterium]